MFSCLLMESRVGEFNETNRIMFNVSFYIFCSFVIWFQSKSSRKYESILFRLWSGLFAYWSISEISSLFFDVGFLGLLLVHYCSFDIISYIGKMEIVQFLFHASWISYLAVCLIAFGTHKYNGTIERWSYIAYVVGSLIFMRYEPNLELFRERPLFFYVIFTASIFYSVGFIVSHLRRRSRFAQLVSQRFGSALPVFWTHISQQEVDLDIGIGFKDTRKVFHSDQKQVFETIFETNTTTPYYYSDFYKEIQIVEGEIRIVFETGEIERLTPEKKTAIRPYEVHKIQVVKRCKLLVTCIC